MSRAPSFAGIVLAAGASSRMRRDKATLPWRGETFLGAAIRSLAATTELVLVVAGDNAELLRPVVYSHGAFLVRNPAPERGQFSSLQCGLSEVLNRGRDAAIVTLVDRPAAAPATVVALKQHFLRGLTREGAPLWALIPEYGSRHGHPFVAGREMIEAFLRAPHCASARDVEHAHQAQIAYLAVDDPNVVANVDTPAEYDALIATSPEPAV